MEKRVRCPYCQKVFRCRIRSVTSESTVIDIVCPYCKEQLVIKKEMIVSGS